MTDLFMADSVQPLQGIPVSYRADRNKGVALYGNGLYSAATDVIGVYPRHLLISVDGAPHTAHTCAILDVERGDATAADFPAWRLVRDQICKDHPFYQWPVVYCSIDPDPTHGVAAVLDACARGDQEEPLHFWIAWYTPGAFVPTATEVAEEIHRQTGRAVPSRHIFGCQYSDFGTFDKSVIYQPVKWA